jgi:hypothetical protein
MSADPKILRTLDDDLKADHNSWTATPDGFTLLVQDTDNGPSAQELLINNTNRLLVQ